jgi:hypothetical protein
MVIVEGSGAEATVDAIDMIVWMKCLLPAAAVVLGGILDLAPLGASARWFAGIVECSCLLQAALLEDLKCDCQTTFHDRVRDAAVNTHKTRPMRSLQQ